MASSEDVLLQVPGVKYKKDAGTLYVMSERIAWIQGNRETVTLSHRFADIKSQKISPEGKAKVQLQIVLHDTSTFNFHFVQAEGLQAQLAARDKVKQLVQTLLLKYKRPIDAELEEKNKLLSEHPALLQLYKDLVIDGVVSSDEFWRVHSLDYLSKIATKFKQDVGVSSGFLSGVQRGSGGVNGITYNLTSDLMESIFKTYPAVRRKHLECVPSQMDESQFWTKFFQSHYFHRDRLPVATDLFSDSAKADDKEMKKALETLRLKNNEIIKVVDDPEKSEEVSMGIEKQDGSVSAHRNMIKRFNQHSIMVLTACERGRGGTETDDSFISGKRDAPLENGNGHLNPEGSKKPKFVESTHLEDLISEPEPSHQKLVLAKTGVYQNGPVPDFHTDPVRPEQVAHATKTLREMVLRWGGKPALLDSKTAVHLLGELSPGGSMMKGTVPETTIVALPPDLEVELRNAYSALTEILRHFWSCFPPSTPALQEKAQRSHETLKRFEQIKLPPLIDKLSRAHVSASHILEVIGAADVKYKQWSSKFQRK